MNAPAPRPRLGLCCQFLNVPGVKFRTATARGLSRLSAEQARQKLLELSHHNLRALGEALRACVRLGITAFRVPSGLLPLATHPAHRYGVADLPQETVALYCEAGELARQQVIRLSFHPDQFVVLSSPSETAVTASVEELVLHADQAELLGADVINIHAGGAYGDKVGALARLTRRLDLLPDAVRRRLTLENDDRTYHVRDLLPLCRAEGVPLVYDVHHHRCHADGLSIGEATVEAAATWNGREPLFHISSPEGGWAARNPRVHAEHIDPSDFPEEWKARAITVDIEARAKEEAVLLLRSALWGSQECV